MAVLCPVFDPKSCIWYVTVFGPDGPEKRFILCPLVYYYQMGVSPPVGAVFSDQDIFEFELYLFHESYTGSLDNPGPVSSMPKHLGDPYEQPLNKKLAPSKLSAVPIIPQDGLSESVPEMTNNLFIPKVPDCPPLYTLIKQTKQVSKSTLKAKEKAANLYVKYPELVLALSACQTNSFEPQPSTSNMFQDSYSPGYSSFDKNLTSSYDNYDEDDDNNKEILYKDPYGEPHNM